MERVKIDLGINSYEIYIDSGLLENFQDFLQEEEDKGLIITDENVDKLYGNALMNLLKDNGKSIEKIVIPPGEESKNLHMVEEILNDMLKKGLTRRSKIIALGGGVVGDIAGFCSSIYMRGIPFIQVPTTLLAQVDSSVGGKTGVNMLQGKNLVGSFYQPQKVIIDIKTLKSLPKRELMSGIGEVIKYGVIYDYEFLKYIKEYFEELISLEKDVMKEVIKRCCQIKSEIVSNDEKEKGLRKILNFGHTIGHGLEALTQYTNYTHGEAVIIGMYYETFIAKELGYINDKYCDEITNFLQKTGVKLDFDNIPLIKLIDYMEKDKKNKDGKISFILPNGKGQVTEVLLNTGEITNILEKILGNEKSFVFQYDPLNKINALRRQIDECDRTLIRTFQKRMELVMEILESKKKNNLPIFYPNREEEVLEKALLNLYKGEYAQEIEVFLREILKISRKLQSRKLFPYNIVLIGFMGTGKSTIGKYLSEKLAMPYIDIDTLIEERVGISINEIFKNYGEAFFREVEKKVIAEVSNRENTIIICGGGAVLKKDNIVNLKRNGKILLLKAKSTTIYERIKQDDTRPLLKDQMTLERIESLLKQREEAYNTSADVIIDTDDKTIEDITTEIIGKLNAIDRSKII